MTFSKQGFVNATARQLEFRLISKQAEIQFEVLANSSFWQALLCNLVERAVPLDSAFRSADHFQVESLVSFINL